MILSLQPKPQGIIWCCRGIVGRWHLNEQIAHHEFGGARDKPDTMTFREYCIAKVGERRKQRLNMVGVFTVCRRVQ